MKLNASAQNAMAFQPALSFSGSWEKGASSRSSFAIRPFHLPVKQRSAAQTDDLARKQEIICAIILGLCLVFSFAICFVQLALRAF